MWCAVVLTLALLPAAAQAAGTTGAQTASSELVGLLTNQLHVTPQQATGGAGALFGLAQSRLKPAEFNQVSAAVPGMDGLLQAAPKPAGGAMGAALGNALPGGTGGLASLAGAFQSLGLSPDMAAKFVPVLTQYVQSKGGANVAALLASALK